LIANPQVAVCEREVCFGVDFAAIGDRAKLAEADLEPPLGEALDVAFVLNR
jgi:hypothetical protein